MNITTRTFRSAFLGAAACAVLLLAGCGGGGGGDIAAGGSDNNPATPGGTDTGTGNGGPATNTYAAVTLDRATGSLAAGTVVPLACIQGGAVADAHVNGCNAVHLHDTITITGVGAFDDPNAAQCGFGKVDIVPKSSLGLSCPALATAAQANALLSVKVDNPQNFGAIMLSLTDRSGSTTVKDIHANLSPGVNKLVQTGLPQYTTASILTYCDRGVDGSGVDRIEHAKTTVSLKLGTPQQYYAECAPAAQQSLTVNLDSAFANGSFYTGSGPAPAAALRPGSNTFSTAVNTDQTNVGGVVIGVDGNGAWSSTALRYPTTGAVPTIAADTNTLSPMPLSAVQDSTYLGSNGYQGIGVLAIAPGIAQTYQQLDGATTNGRNIRAVPNLSAIGGVHDVRARFAAVESSSNAAQTAAVSRYYTTPPATVPFNTARPAYFTAGSYSVANGSNGFTFTNRYRFSDNSLTPVLLSLLAQTGGGATVHDWLVNDYSASGTSTNATWPTDYLTTADTLSGGTVPRPTGSDLTAISYQAASAPAAARNHALDPTGSAASLNGSTQAEVDYAP